MGRWCNNETHYHKNFSTMYHGGVKETLIVVNVLLVVATIFLNAMICAAVYKVKRLRTPSNVVLFSLSVADLLVSADFVSQIVFLVLEKDATVMPCLAMGMYHYIIVTIIILHLAAISFDRLLAIQWHMRYKTAVTCKRMLACVVFLWILGFLHLLPKLLAKGDRHKEMAVFYKFILNCSPPKETYNYEWLHEKRGHGCHEREAVLKKAQLHMVALLIVNVALPFAIIAASYAVILKTSIKHYKQIKAQKVTNIAGKTTEIRAANTIAIIVVSFLLCFTPMFAVSVVKIYTRPCWGKHFALKILATIQSLSAVLNPLIYAGRNQEFKAAFRKILGFKPKEQSSAFAHCPNKLPSRENVPIAESPQVEQDKPEEKADSGKQE